MGWMACRDRGFDLPHSDPSFIENVNAMYRGLVKAGMHLLPILSSRLKHYV